jgi:hypothetical protein
MVETKVEPKKPVILLNALTNHPLFLVSRKKTSCPNTFYSISNGTMEQTSNV